MHRPVEVLTDGQWYPGILDRWRRCDQRGWIGHVWWYRGVGLQHVEWIKAEQLRPSEPTSAEHPSTAPVRS
ncbi:MAG TPA: hypothetical protein VFH54_01795 [Mycobacteriales bacterium]|nr:hypothetical protein [Mycobacteriales bacterium]